MAWSLICLGWALLAVEHARWLDLGLSLTVTRTQIARFLPVRSPQPR
jgi:hypothetical protein